jgi:hypothetical protein
MAVLPSLAAKHAHGEAHGVLCVPLFWENSVLATWTICSRKTIENKKPTRRAEDELVEHVCLSRWRLGDHPTPVGSATFPVTKLLRC